MGGSAGRRERVEAGSPMGKEPDTGLNPGSWDQDQSQKQKLNGVSRQATWFVFVLCFKYNVIGALPKHAVRWTLLNP